MKKLLIILLLIPLMCTAQFKGLNFGGKILTFQGQVLTDYARLISSINYDNLEITTTKLFDNTTYGNNWTLKNSNGVKFNGVAFVSLPDTVYIPFDREFTVQFYASLNQPTWGMICGGLSSSDYIAISETGMRIRTPNLSLTVADISTPNDDIIRHYIINIDTDSIEIINNTDSDTAKILNNFGADSIGVRRLANRQSTGTLNGYLFGLDLNGEHTWPMAEGYAKYCYDVTSDTNCTIENYVDSLRVLQDLYHWNLYYGFSNYYNSPTEQIKVPFDMNRDSLDVTIPFYDYDGKYIGGQWHNSAETGVEPPLSLLPFDYNNYLFDVSNNPNVIYYDNMSENVGNRIFINVSTPYQYKDIRVYNRAVN